MIDFRRAAIAIGIAVVATAAAAQERPARPGHSEQGRQEQGGPGVLSLLPADSVTEHSVDTAQRQARLHGDRRHVLVVRSIRRALGRRLLYGLRCEIRNDPAAGR
jgi:hypothetical protein